MLQNVKPSIDGEKGNLFLYGVGGCGSRIVDALTTYGKQVSFMKNVLPLKIAGWHILDTHKTEIQKLKIIQEAYHLNNQRIEFERKDTLRKLKEDYKKEKEQLKLIGEKSKKKFKNKIESVPKKFVQDSASVLGFIDRYLFGELGAGTGHTWVLSYLYIKDLISGQNEEKRLLQNSFQLNTSLYKTNLSTISAIFYFQGLGFGGTGAGAVQRLVKQNCDYFPKSNPFIFSIVNNFGGSLIADSCSENNSIEPMKAVSNILSALSLNIVKSDCKGNFILSNDALNEYYLKFNNEKSKNFLNKPDINISHYKKFNSVIRQFIHLLSTFDIGIHKNSNNSEISQRSVDFSNLAELSEQSTRIGSQYSRLVVPCMYFTKGDTYDTHVLIENAVKWGKLAKCNPKDADAVYIMLAIDSAKSKEINEDTIKDAMPELSKIISKKALKKRYIGAYFLPRKYKFSASIVLLVNPTFPFAKNYISNARNYIDEEITGSKHKDMYKEIYQIMDKGAVLKGIDLIEKHFVR